ncbi:hypothetical protein PTKIN_Ptkin16aG0017800 [Pterospermum kingtungense]
MKSLISLFQETKLKDDILRKMEILLLAVGKVLGDAVEKQTVNLFVNKWLDKFKDAAYDAENLLDAVETTCKFEDQLQK